MPCLFCSNLSNNKHCVSTATVSILAGLLLTLVRRLLLQAMEGIGHLNKDINDHNTLVTDIMDLIRI